MSYGYGYNYGAQKKDDDPIKTVKIKINMFKDPLKSKNILKKIYDDFTKPKPAQLGNMVSKAATKKKK